MIQSMAAANMSELDIARQLGISREEVGLVLSMNERG
jgi:DNA-binding CsgD family transcriptional regulator